MKRRSLIAGLVLTLCGAVVGQDGSIAWEPDFDETLRAAKADGKPIMIAFIMDDEPANDEVVQSHFHDKDVVALSRNFHCLVCSVGVHSATSAEGVCPRFGCNTCASHQRILMRAQTIYLQAPEVSAPQFLFLKPDGETMLLRHVWLLPPAELVKKMRRALGFNDPSKVTEAEKQATEDVTLALAEANDNNAMKRTAGLRKLATLDDPRILEFLIKQTGEGIDETRRLEAVDAMGTRGNAKALPVLLKLLKTKSSQLRNHVAIALEKLAMPEAGPGLRAALKNEQKDNVRGNLVRALAICDPKTPEHMKAIIAMVDSGGQKERIAAIRASFDVAMCDSLKKSLLVAAKDNTAQIRGAAFCALAHHRVKDAVPIIEKAIPQEKVMDVKAIAQGALSILTQPEYSGPAPSALISRLLTDDYFRSY